MVNFQLNIWSFFDQFSVEFNRFEYYVDNLPLNHLRGINQQPNTGYFVIDTTYKKSQLAIGLGKGFATSTDNWVVKAIGAFSF